MIPVTILGTPYIFNPKKEEQTMQAQIVTLNCTLTVTTAYGEPRLEIYPKDEAWRASSVCTVLDDNFELVLPRDKIDTLYTDKLLLEVQTANESYQKALQALEKANNFLGSLDSSFKIILNK